MHTDDLKSENLRLSIVAFLNNIHRVLFGGGEWEIRLPTPFERASKPYLRDNVVMQRKVKGEWQYRAPTDEEFSEYHASRAW